MEFALCRHACVNSGFVPQSKGMHVDLLVILKSL